jgi:hypothetical protein
VSITADEVIFPEGTVATISGLKNARVRVFPSALLGRFGRKTKFRGNAPYMVKTARFSRGSVRYSEYASYEAALAYAFEYARRVK